MVLGCCLQLFHYVCFVSPQKYKFPKVKANASPLFSFSSSHIWCHPSLFPYYLFLLSMHLFNNRLSPHLNVNSMRAWSLPPPNKWVLTCGSNLKESFEQVWIILNMSGSLVVFTGLYQHDHSLLFSFGLSLLVPALFLCLDSPREHLPNLMDKETDA